MSRWITACGLDDLPDGQMRCIGSGDDRILLARLGDRVFATDLICTHAEADLSMGFLTPEGVRCPLHLSVFDLESGAPQNPPAELPLRTFNVKIADGRIHVEV